MSDQGKKEASPAATQRVPFPGNTYVDSASTYKDAKTRLEQVRDILAEVWQEGYEAGKSATPSGLRDVALAKSCGGEKWTMSDPLNDSICVHHTDKQRADLLKSCPICRIYANALQPQDDTKRLDWLEKTHWSAMKLGTDNWVVGNGRGKTVREAIDAAMRKEAK